MAGSIRINERYAIWIKVVGAPRFKLQIFCPRQEQKRQIASSPNIFLCHASRFCTVFVNVCSQVHGRIDTDASPNPSHLRRSPERGKDSGSRLAVDRLACASSYPRHAATCPGNAAQSCTTSTGAFSHGNNSGGLHACQRERSERRRGHGRRSIVPKCFQVRGVNP